MAKKSSSAGFKSSLQVPSDGDGHSMHNEILAGLSKKECEAVFSNLEFVEMRIHDVLNEMGEPIKYCYFVNSGLTSILNVMSDGKSVEVGLTGKEGFVGLPVVVGLRGQCLPNQRSQAGRRSASMPAARKNVESLFPESSLAIDASGCL